MIGSPTFLAKEMHERKRHHSERVISRVLTFIRFSHTIFALPFALGSMFVAAGGWPSGRLFLLVLLAMIFARTAAMTFNRLADWKIDQLNPRTAERHRLISFRAAVVLLLCSSAAFVVTTWFVNRVCFVLSPLALAIIFFYSVTKRFTSLTHFFLGIALAVSPIGAWLAVRGELHFAPLVLGGAVLFWVTGFDIIYAAQDLEFDKQMGLRSVMVRLGVAGSLLLSQTLHVLAVLGFIAFGLMARLGAPYYLGTAVIVWVLVYEQITASKGDVTSINQAFFLSNAIVGTVFLAAVLLDMTLAQ
jgi:4-hydroxybenzoate polyprenyltransferase